MSASDDEWATWTQPFVCYYYYKMFIVGNEVNSRSLRDFLASLNSDQAFLKFSVYLTARV